MRNETTFAKAMEKPIRFSTIYLEKDSSWKKKEKKIIIAYLKKNKILMKTT